MRSLFRLLTILRVCLRFGLDQLALDGAARTFDSRLLTAVLKLSRIGRSISTARGVRLRMALEHLGPIFVKFGQVLSTRRDVLPEDIADELAKLQDQVPPFDSGLAVATIERSLGRPISEIFSEFDRTPIASASIAQVHPGHKTRHQLKPGQILLNDVEHAGPQYLDGHLTAVDQPAQMHLGDRSTCDGCSIELRENFRYGPAQ